MASQVWMPNCEMTTAAQTLAEFAAGLKFDSIPSAVIERAKDCVIDTVGACIYGSTLAWSRIVIGYAERYGKGGRSAIIGTPLKVQAPHAALANGALAHAFEMDSLVQPSVGVHPGASLTAPGLAVAQETGASGKEFITAFVAAGEVMHRIGDASLHSSEKLGFHAPGLTGAFGGAVVAGRLLKLDTGQMTNALGIAGSLCAGLLEFSKSGGGMVKRLHLGRAAESGVLAAALARDGFTGPHTVLEGRFGYLNVFCRDGDAKRFTAGLGEIWNILRITFKRYSCHITAHVPVTAVLELKTRYGISGDDVASITVAGSEKMVSHHDIPEPQDMTMAQYSTPFCVALAFYRDPRDPDVFSDAAVNDPAIRALCRKVKVELRQETHAENPLASRVTVRLKDGRELVQDQQYFPGMSQQPLSRAQLQEKFNTITAVLPAASRERIFAQLAALESAGDAGQLQFS
ncbi:MAG: MmgE/PrpD family protein [Betaproteobacteria bacterium]|nr:MmgE/PrpD family protein [Betaproteobacteria bacterium]